MEVGDRLLINDEEVIFKGWVDQSQTAIEVRASANDGSPVKEIRAKEINSLMRSPDAEGYDSSSKPESERSRDSTVRKEKISESVTNESIPPDSEPSSSETQTNGDRTNADQSNQTSPNNSDTLEGSSQTEEASEILKEPEYNAWEVWTYLERQRVKTLKLINTFHAEWEANRFVREAERSAPPNLRVHYEIRPVLLDEAELNGSYQKPTDPHKSQDSQPDRGEEDYADAIDVEVIL